MRLQRSKSLKHNGYKFVGNSRKAKRSISRGRRKGDFTVDVDSLKIYHGNILAFKKTFGGKNIRPLLEANAENIVVPYVRRKIPLSKKGEYNWFYSKGERRFKVYRGNMRKSFQVLKHRKKFRADNVVFVGPKANFRGGRAKKYGTTEKNANAFYAPGRESRFRSVVEPAMKRIAPRYLQANANAIAVMIRR